VPSAEKAKALWKKYRDDPNIDRDNLGIGGREQLFIPNVKRAREKIRDNYIDNEQSEGSQRIKAPKHADITLLRDHVGRQDVSYANDFLRGKSSSSVDGPAAIPKGELPKAAPRKVALEREVPKLGQQMDKDIKSLKADMAKTMATAEKAKELVKTTVVSLNDRASHLYKSTLQFRLQVASRWSGDLNAVIVLGAEPVAAVPLPLPLPGATAVAAIVGQAWLDVTAQARAIVSSKSGRMLPSGVFNCLVCQWWLLAITMRGK
jgi:hypothetical protein